MMRRNSGFTLIELLIALALVSVLAVATLGLQYLLAENREVAIDNYFSVDSANNNLNSLVREIRTARISNSGAYPIFSASDDEIIFFSDVDFDGDAERIRYTRTDETLVRGLIEPVGQPAQYPVNNELVKDVSTYVRNGSTPVFTYYNEDWPEDTTNNPLSTPPSLAEVKLVKVYLAINSKEDETDDYILDSFAQIRTLKENL